MAHEIEGYADVVSAAAGQDVHISVSTTAPTYTWTVFRVGFYGGAGGRQVASGGPLPGGVQAAATFDPVTGLVEAPWQPSFTVPTPGWLTGAYLVLLAASTGEQSYAIFVLRDDRRDAEVALQLSTATWQAYNRWGGESLYETTHGMSGGKARKVSYNRPYEAAEGFGAGVFMQEERSLAMWLESRGVDVEYTTDLDTGGPHGRVGQHRVFIAVGHDEYGTLDGLDRLAQARDAGTSLVFLTGDTQYWQVRYEGGDRIQTCYKDMIDEDPAYGVDDAHVTTKFRDPPVLRPENALFGVMSQGEAGPPMGWIVNNSASWVYAGSGLVDGDAIPGLVGYEWDTWYGDGHEPAGVTLLATSPTGGLFSQNAALYERNGAYVFAAGTIDFARHLDDARVDRIMQNLLTRAGVRLP